MKNMLVAMISCLLLANSAYSQMQITFVTDSVSCFGQQDGNIEALVSGGSAPYSYYWSTTDTTSALTGVAVGTYDLIVTDGLGNTVSATGYVFGPPSLNYIFYTIPANCGATDGGATANIQNGAQPLTYAWSNFTSGSAILNVPSGGYSLTITDANGCVSHQNVVIPKDSTCFGEISGMAFFDTDSNCLKNNNEVGLRHKLIEISPGYFAVTKTDGSYKIEVDAGNYSSKIIKYNNPLTYYNLFCIPGDSLTANLNVDDTLRNQNFPIKVPVVRDVSVALRSHRTIPGANQELTVTIKNHGGASIPYVSGYIMLDTINTGAYLRNPPAYVAEDSFVVDYRSKLYFTLTNLDPYQSKQFTVYSANPAIPILNIGDRMRHTAYIEVPAGYDDNLDNNTRATTTVVVAAYDPNDKQVFSNGYPVDGVAAPQDTVLKYLVRFQNTGNNVAYNVTVKDTFDIGLSPRSFQFLGSSHDCRVEFHADNIVHFVFDDINLVDTSVSYLESQGHFEYSLTVAEPSIYDVPIYNQAAIYFDYNPPIFTNIVQTTRIAPIDTTTVGQEILVKELLSVYPNPASQFVTISLLSQPINSVALYDYAGRLVAKQTDIHATTFRWFVNDVAQGMYLLEVRSGEKRFRKMLVLSIE